MLYSLTPTFLPCSIPCSLALSLPCSTVRVQMLNGSMGEVRVEVEKRMARKVHTMELGMERRFLRGMVRFSLFVVLTPLTYTTLHATSRILSL